MAYWTYPSDVTSSDDKINYWREQYESLGEDENAPLLGSTKDNLNAVINYRGWSDEGIDSLAKLIQLHGIQSLLNEYTVKTSTLSKSSITIIIYKSSFLFFMWINKFKTIFTSF